MLDSRLEEKKQIGEGLWGRCTAHVTGHSHVGVVYVFITRSGF